MLSEVVGVLVNAESLGYLCLCYGRLHLNLISHASSQSYVCPESKTSTGGNADQTHICLISAIFLLAAMVGIGLDLLALAW
jgi:hypothetical protein